MTDANLDTVSYRQFGEGGYWLTKPAMQWFWDAHVPPDQRHLPTVSPLQASLDQLHGLPPALLIVDENDVLRDEGEAYARKLQQAEIPVTAMRALGTVHDFIMLNALAETPPRVGRLCRRPHCSGVPLPARCNWYTTARIISTVFSGTVKQ